MTELIRRLRYLLQRRRFDDELANDLEFHREMAARAGGGGAPLGNTLRVREEAREAWGWMWLDRAAQDLRYAARMLLRSPGFTLAAMLMLAIGIGVNVAAFGFFNMMVLRPLPVRDPDSILRFQRRSQETFASDVPYPAMAFYRAHSRTLSAVLAIQHARLAVEGEPAPVGAQFVTGNFFSDLGAGAALGRTLDEARDEAADAAPVVVLGHGYWQRRFGGSSSIVGRTLHVNGKPATVVGVAARDFSGLYLDQPDLWLPLAQQPYIVNGSALLTDFSNARDGVNMWGRLQPGATPAAAEEELRALAATLRLEHPHDVWEHERLVSQVGGYGKGTRSGLSRGSGEEPDARREMSTVAALIGTLSLLILAAACGNLGSLLLARGVARTRELTIRAAVGAGAGRLIRQLFTESLLLAVLGSLAGLGLGYVVLRALMRLSEAAPWLDATPDWRVMLFAVGMGFVAAILFGLAPAFHAARQRQHATLARQILIGAQVAASCVLLVVAGLLVRALDEVRFMQPGFEYRQVVSIDPGLGTHGYSADRSRTYLETLQARLRDQPGVESTALALVAPLGNKKIFMGATIGGRTIEAHVNRIEPPFFETMKIPILRGRNLAPGDTQAVIVGESLARRGWPDEDPIGKTLSTGTDASGAPITFSVVGVAGSARFVALEDPSAVEVYFPATAEDLPSMIVIVRTSAPPEGLAQRVGTIAKAVDADVFPEARILRSAFDRKLQSAERSALAVSVLGASALLLACMGIVGLVAYAVSQRTKEIGIRMALGAKRAHVLAVVLRQFSRPVAAGLLVGVGAAAASTQVLQRTLYGVSHLDPLAYLAAVGVFVVTVALAALWPARRALRIDPLRALRCD